RSADIIRNLRAMFAKGAMEKAPVRINRIIWTVLDLVHNEIQRHQIEIRTDLDSHLPVALGNRVELQQVILNLIMNAIEAMHSASTRVLRLRSKAINPDTIR